MIARCHGGPADGLLVYVRGHRDRRAGQRTRRVALIAVFECQCGDQAERVAVEHPEYPDTDLLNSAAGLWRYYYAPEPEPEERPEDAGVDWRPAPVDFTAE